MVYNKKRQVRPVPKVAKRGMLVPVPNSPSQKNHQKGERYGRIL